MCYLTLLQIHNEDVRKFNLSAQLACSSFVAKLRAGLGRQAILEINTVGASEHAAGSTTGPLVKRCVG
jgi:hypothetical protein